MPPQKFKLGLLSPHGGRYLDYRDMMDDLADKAWLGHMLIEAGSSSLSAASAALAWIAGDWLAARREIGRLGDVLVATRAESERWHQEARQNLEGLSATIDRQFVGLEYAKAQSAR